MCWFLWLWGFNYARVPLETQMQLDIKKLSQQELVEEAYWVLEQCVKERQLIPQADTFALNETHYPWDMEQEMRRLLVQVLDSLGYPTPG
ncbi:MAG: DUF3810 family protein, partial [Flammeovirgaceae bacterium]